MSFWKKTKTKTKTEQNMLKKFPIILCIINNIINLQE